MDRIGGMGQSAPRTSKASPKTVKVATISSTGKILYVDENIDDTAYVMLEDRAWWLMVLKARKEEERIIRQEGVIKEVILQSTLLKKRLIDTILVWLANAQ